MNKQIREFTSQDHQWLEKIEPIDLATNEEIGKLLVVMTKIINNQTEILKKQEEAIKAIQKSSNQSSMYSIISIVIAVIAVVVAIVLGLN